MIELKKHTGAIALALVGWISVSAVAEGACTVEQGENVTEVQQEWPSNASHEALRSAYAQDRCHILQGLHPGGDPCIAGQGTQHITVQKLTANGNVSRTFHVFNYTTMVDGVERQCSTR